MSGMTPTTSMLGIDLVSACSNGGYHCEFAGGGLPLPNYTYDKFSELQAAQDPGVGITLNTLYANPYLWGFQYPIVCELRKKGTPIESLTIGAGGKNTRDLSIAGMYIHLTDIPTLVQSRPLRRPLRSATA